MADVKSAAEFITYCLKVDPAKRPSAQDLMDHSWLASGYECSSGDWILYAIESNVLVRNPLNLYGTAYLINYGEYIRVEE